MQKLHLFIARSGKPEPDIRKVLDSFGDHTVIVWQYVENDYDLINETIKLAPWYGIIYDNECVDEAFARSLPEFMAMADEHEVLGVFRKIDDEKCSRSPRFYKKHVKLQTNSLMPANGELILPMLNGWLMEYDTSGIYQK